MSELRTFWWPGASIPVERIEAPDPLLLSGILLPSPPLTTVVPSSW
ncbi:MAG TPA: hypothetical protein VFN35_06265 [Ktedonobacteraceae bacterium]|nr:hypothetical protein [Ktedonobacteraceae bacterium]